MTPQELVTALINKENEEQGRPLIQAELLQFNKSMLERLVYLLRKEADHHWNADAQTSLKLSGYLIFVGDLTQNRSYHALGLMTRGEALRRLDKDQESLPFFDAAGEDYIHLHDDVGWARTRIGRISACLRLNRTTEALRDAEAARAIFMQHQKYRRAGQIDVNAAIVHFEVGDYEQALVLFDRAIDTYRRLDEDASLNIARAQANKAITLAALGKFREASALHEQACETFAAMGTKEDISVAREELNIADIAEAQGYHSRALHFYLQSAERFQKHDMHFSYFEVAQQTCLCLVRLNRLQEAYDLADEAVNFFRRLPGQEHNLARSLMQKAMVAMAFDNVEEAGAMLHEASIRLEEIGYTALAAIARLRRAELHFVTHAFSESAQEVDDVARVFIEHKDQPHLVQALFLQARLSDVDGEIAHAVSLCQQAFAIAQQQELLDLQYQCNDLLGQLAERQGDYTAAIAYYDRAIQGIEEVQSKLVFDEQSSFLEDKDSIYQRAVILALHLDQQENALLYVERAKSRVLNDYLRNNIDIRLHVGRQGDLSLVEDLVHLREEQAWYSSVVYNSENDGLLNDSTSSHLRTAEVVQARQEMRKRERHIESILGQLQQSSVNAEVPHRQPEQMRTIVTSVRQHLGADTCAVEYYLDKRDLAIFVITQQGIHVQMVPGVAPRLKRYLSLWRTNVDLAGKAAGTEERAQTFNGLLENGLGLLQILHQILIEPVITAVSAYSHMIVIPYGVLHYLPFHCLFDGAQFMIERKDISYAPSLSVLDICHQRAERLRANGIHLEESLVMGVTQERQLPFVMHEAEMVAQQLHVPCFLGIDATSERLQQIHNTCPLVHIAAHGHFRLDAPNFSFIQLADRQMSSIEAFNLDLSGCALLVLSACETGRVVIGGIDEFMGLGRGFLYAGAASLLPTLWKIDDASSAELMTLFYQSLLQGYGKAAALAIAQRIFLARVRGTPLSFQAHPFFWGAFQLLGDEGPLF